MQFFFLVEEYEWFSLMVRREQGGDDREGNYTPWMHLGSQFCLWAYVNVLCNENQSNPNIVVNFMCQLDQTKDAQIGHKTLYLRVSVRVFSEDINV